MIVITVARKPPQGSVAQTVMRWATGGVNVDGCRVAGVPQIPGSSNISAPDMQSMGKGWNACASRRAESYIVNPPTGRWPANLILQHSLFCVSGGAQVIPTMTHYPASRGKGSVRCGTEGHKGQTGLEESAPKTETVTDWACIRGCPVAGMDEQSGWLCSGQVKPGYMRNNVEHGGGGFQKHFGDTPLSGFGDSGGASRYFKQVKGE